MVAAILPKHVAIIMDGNGRWAKKRGFPRLYGHVKGANAVDKVIDHCLTKGIEVLTLFAFGFENWNRPDKEISSLQKLFYTQLRKKSVSLHKKNVRLKFIGESEAFEKKLQLEEKNAVALTEDNTRLTLVIAASYSGQWDICNAAKRLAEKVQQGTLSADAITPALLQENLATKDLPAPDLFIRTSGEQRLSNFLLWQLAYAELYFTPVYWPDFSVKEFDKALEWFADRERRFGKTSEQLEGKI